MVSLKGLEQDIQRRLCFLFEHFPKAVELYLHNPALVLLIVLKSGIAVHIWKNNDACLYLDTMIHNTYGDDSFIVHPEGAASAACLPPADRDIGRQINRLLNKTQADIIEELFITGQPWLVKLFRKLDPAGLNMSFFDSLKDRLSYPAEVKFLQHIDASSLNSYRPLLKYKASLSLIHNWIKEGHLAEELEWVIGDFCKDRNFMNVYTIYEYNNRLREMVKEQAENSDPSPAAPLKPLAGMYYIESAIQLYEEGSVMKHCVYSYRRHIASGVYAVYAMTEPERCTIGLRLKQYATGPFVSKIDAVDQIFGPGNSEVSDSTKELVLQWIESDANKTKAFKTTLLMICRDAADRIGGRNVLKAELAMSDFSNESIENCIRKAHQLVVLEDILYTPFLSMTDAYRILTGFTGGVLQEFKSMIPAEYIEAVTEYNPGDKGANVIRGLCDLLQSCFNAPVFSDRRQYELFDENRNPTGLEHILQAYIQKHFPHLEYDYLNGMYLSLQPSEGADYVVHTVFESSKLAEYIPQLEALFAREFGSGTEVASLFVSNTDSEGEEYMHRGFDRYSLTLKAGGVLRVVTLLCITMSSTVRRLTIQNGGTICAYT